jgi:hypothetical protein
MMALSEVSLRDRFSYGDNLWKDYEDDWQENNELGLREFPVSGSFIR